MIPKETNGSIVKRPNEITGCKHKIEHFAAANVQLTRNLKYMAMELERREQCWQKYNDLLSSNEKTQRTNQALLERIESERVMHVQQMEECREQHQSQIDEVRHQMSDNMQELYELRDEVIRAKKVIWKTTKESSHLRKKIHSKNWEIAKWQRQVAFCLANIEELKALILDYKRCNAEYKVQNQYLKQHMANQFKQYQSVMANNRMESAKICKRKCEAIGGIDCCVASKRLHQTTQLSSNKETSNWRPNSLVLFVIQQSIQWHDAKNN